MTRLYCGAISWAWGLSCGMVSEMSGSPIPNLVPAAPQRRRRRKRGIVPMGGRAPLSPKERELHAQLLAEGKLMSGKCGGHDYYVVNGKQRWRRHAVPKDPCTLAQQRSRARFAAASKTWSENGPLTEALRDAWCADGAKRQSRPRLGQSGPLTGQQNYIRRNCTRKKRECEMLLHPRQRDEEKVENKGLRPELTAQVSQSQPITRSTSGTRRASAGYSPSTCRACRGYAREFKARQLVLQVPRLKRFTRSTSGRSQGNTRPTPERYQSHAFWKAGPL